MKKDGNTSSALMEQRAPAIVEGDDPKRALHRALDFFPTPPWAARAGAEIVKSLDPAARTVWEPACGQGHMAFALAEYFEHTLSSDIHPFGYGKVNDFLETCYVGADVDWVMTNPPFKLAPDFIRKGLKVARCGVAVLCRMAFLESAARFELLFGGEHPMTVMSPFVERVPMELGRWDPKGSTATAYAWFVFEKRPSDFACRILPIAPGTRARLTKTDDARRFGPEADIPLFNREENSHA